MLQLLQKGWMNVGTKPHTSGFLWYFFQDFNIDLLIRMIVRIDATFVLA